MAYVVGVCSYINCTAAHPILRTQFDQAPKLFVVSPRSCPIPSANDFKGLSTLSRETAWKTPLGGSKSPTSPGGALHAPARGGRCAPSTIVCAPGVSVSPRACPTDSAWWHGEDRGAELHTLSPGGGGQGVLMSCVGGRGGILAFLAASDI